jgi:hypothetical protein
MHKPSPSAKGVGSSLEKVGGKGTAQHHKCEGGGRTSPGSRLGAKPHCRNSCSNRGNDCVRNEDP